MATLPPLGQSIFLTDAVGYHPDEFLAAAKRCFDACPDLDRIIMLWEAPGEDVDGEPCGQSCDITWVANPDRPITPRTTGISDAFKAAAWDFNEGFGRITREFGDRALRDQVSALRIGRNLSLWWFDNDDYRRDPMEYAWQEGRRVFAETLRPVFLTQPSAHEEIAKIDALATDMPKVYEALTTETDKD